MELKVSFREFHIQTASCRATILLSISKFEWIIFIDFLLFFLLQKGVHKLHAKGALE